MPKQDIKPKYVLELDTESIDESRLRNLWHIHIPKTGGNYVKEVFKKCVPKIWE